MLCYVTLCYIVSCYVILCYLMLRYAMLSYVAFIMISTTFSMKIDWICYCYCYCHIPYCLMRVHKCIYLISSYTFFDHILNNWYSFLLLFNLCLSFIIPYTGSGKHAIFPFYPATVNRTHTLPLPLKIRTYTSTEYER